MLPSHTAVGEVVEIDPPRRLVLAWGWEDGSWEVPAGSTTVEYELLPEGSGTRLHFTHRDLPSKESAEAHGLGWDHYHERLVVAATGGDPGPDPWLTERSSDGEVRLHLHRRRHARVRGRGQAK